MALADLVPAALVVVLALTSATPAPPAECADIDGPQFRCWLQEVEHE